MRAHALSDLDFAVCSAKNETGRTTEHHQSQLRSGQPANFTPDCRKSRTTNVTLDTPRTCAIPGPAVFHVCYRRCICIVSSGTEARPIWAMRRIFASKTAAGVPIACLALDRASTTSSLPLSVNFAADVGGWR